MDARHILKTWRAATPEERAEGETWYHDAHAIARSLSPHDVRRGAGVLAALSPQTSWPRNVELASRAFADGRATGQTRDACRKADRILAGESPETVLGGNKVRAFYALIAEPADPWSVCVDRHAVSVAEGRKIAGRHLGLTPAQYERIADLYRRAAKTVRSTPAVVQAVTWVVERNRNGGKRGGARRKAGRAS